MSNPSVSTRNIRQNPQSQQTANSNRSGYTANSNYPPNRGAGQTHEYFAQGPAGGSFAYRGQPPPPPQTPPSDMSSSWQTPHHQYSNQPRPRHPGGQHRYQVQNGAPPRGDPHQGVSNNAGGAQGPPSNGSMGGPRMNYPTFQQIGPTGFGTHSIQTIPIPANVGGTARAGGMSGQPMFNAAPPGAQVRHQLPPAQMAYSTQAPWFQYGPQQQAQAFIYVANTNQRWPNPAAAYNPTALYTQPTAIRGTPPAQPPPTPPQVPQAPIPQAEHKRAKNVLRIEDPTTGALLNEDYIAQNASSSIATSTSSGDASGQTATSGAGRPSGGAAPGPGPPSAPHSGMGGPPSSAVPSMHPPSATLANTAFPPPSPAVRMPQSQPSSEASVPQSYDPSSGAPMAPHHGMHPGVPRGPAPMMTTYQAQANSNMGAAGDPTMQNWYVPGYHQRSYLHHQQRMPMMMGGHPPSEKGSHAVKIEAPPPSSSTPRVATPPQQPPQQPPSHPPPPASTGQPTPPPAAPSSTTPAPAPTPAPKQPPTAPAAAPAPSQTTATATPPQVPQKEPEQATESSVGRASQKPKSRPLAKQKDANLRWEDRKMGGDLDAFAISATEEESKPVEEKKQAPAPTPAPEPPKETPAALPSRAAPVSTEAPPPPVSFADAAKRKDSSGGRPPSKEPSPPAPSVPPPVEKVDTSTPPPPTPAPVAVPPPAAPRPASPPPPAEPEKKEPSAPPPPPVSKPAPAPSAALEKKDSDVVAVTPSFILDPALKPVTQSTTPEETAPTDPAPATAPLVEGVEDIESAEEGEEFESPMTDPDVAPSAEDSKEDSPGTQKGMFLQPNDYGPETWSPVNPEGLKRYDRDFLIKFQQHPLAQRPLNIQPTEVLLDKPTVKVIRTPESPGGVGQMNFGSMKRNQYVPTRHSSEVDFAPSFVRNQPGMMPPMSSQSMYGRAQAQQVRGSRGSQQGNRAGPPRVLPSLSISSAKVELATAEKAWLPKRQQSATHESLDEEKRQMEELERQVRAILNKLTPQKFDTLVSKVKALKIETPQALEKVIDLVFAKAVDEPNFAEAYAKMCLEVQEKKISITDEKGEKVEYKFKKLLLNRCQQEFELAETGDKEKKTYEERIEAAETEEKRKELRAEMDEAAMKVRKRYLGVIVFIGQLFKLGMLTMPIMYRCMDQLLEHWKTTLVEDYIECLCRLLTTIGYRLEFYFKASKDDPLRQPLHKTIPPNLRQENLQRLGPVLQQMKNLSDNKKELSSRVRFGLKDVIELQQNGWVPRARQNANAPKTIDQIHTEAEMEEHKKAAERSLPLASNTGGGGGGGGKQRRMEDKQRRNPITDSEGFQFKGGNKTYQKVDIDASKVPMVKRQEEDDAAMSLRPTTRGWGMRPAGMSQGMEPSLATGGSGGAPFLSVVNKYAMLDASSSLGASSEQMGRRGHGGGGSNYKSSSQNLPPRLQKQQKGGLASDRERSSSRGGSGRRSVPPTAAPVLPMAKDGAPPAPWARSTRSQDAPPARTEGSPLLRTAGDATLPRAGRKNLSQSPARQNAAAPERRAVNGTEKLDAQKLDKGKVKEVAKKLVAIVSQHSDCDESIESVIGVYEPNSVGPLLLEVLDQSVDVLSPKTWPLLREILGDIATRPDLASVGALTSCLQMFAANLGNLALDFPQIFDFFGEVTSSLVVKQPSPFAFLCEVLKSLKSPDKIDEYDVPEERWQYAEKTFAACVKKMSDRIGKDSLAASWRKGGKDLEEFLSPEQSLSSLGIEFLVPPRAIILSLLESNCKVAKNGQKELDFQPIVQWSENDSPVRAGSEEFIQALIQAVCDFCITEGTGDACKFVEKNLEACILLLKRFSDAESSVCKDPELEYIFAFQDALKWREFPKSLQMHQLLTFLIDHDIISAESITDWSKNTKADNVALTNCNRLLNYIKQEAEMEPDEDDDEERESSVPSDTTAAPSQPPATSSVAKEGESSSHS